MRIDGIDHLTAEQLEAELAAGGRFVFYEFCISFVVLSLRCPTRIYYQPPPQPGRWGSVVGFAAPVLRGLPWVLVSLIFGWWGLPWGIIYTPLTMFTNLCGGQDVTDEVCDYVLATRATAPGSVG